MTDFLWALEFLLIYELLSLPLRFLLASTGWSRDTVRALSRVAGPALLSVGFWLLAYRVPGILHPAATWLVLITALVLSVQKFRERHPGESPVKWVTGVDPFLEGTTLVLFLGFVAFKRWCPEFTTFSLDGMAAEKFVNAMIFWADWHATSRPPTDYWLAGVPLAYYDGGHFHWAWAAKAAGLPATIALNLAFARAVTLVWESAYFLARSMGLEPRTATLAGVLATWGGNPAALRSMDSVLGTGWTTPSVEYFDIWGPSRAISNHVVDEFPAFSSLLGDFHSHHLALPWFNAWLGLWFAGVSAPRDKECPGGGLVVDVTMVSCGVMTMITNMWNLPALAGLCGLGLAVRWYRGLAWKRFLVTSVTLGALCVMAAILIRGGVGEIVPGKSAEADTGALVKFLPRELQTDWTGFMAMWGWPVLVLVLGGVIMVTREEKIPSRLGLALLAALVLTHAAAAPWTPGGFFWVPLSLAVVTLAMFPVSGPLPAGNPPVLAACWVTLALLEVLYVDDAMGGQEERYNTYFKYCYLVWSPLHVASTAVLAWVWSAPAGRVAGGLKRLAVVLLLGLASLYTVLGMPARAMQNGHQHGEGWTPTLNAYDFLEFRKPSSRDAFPYHLEIPVIRWIRDNVPPGDIVLEGVWFKEWQNPPEYTSGGYDFHGRVASLAGRPVSLGWGGHERTWRGMAGHRLVDERERQIDAVFMAADPGEMRAALDRLGARWVLYGLLERRRYGIHHGRDAHILGLLEAVGKRAFSTPEENPQVFLYDVR